MVDRIACIGAGTVGHAWAVVFARAGYDVSLFDIRPDAVREHALPAVGQTLRLLADGGMLDEPVDVILARVHDAQTIAEAVADVVYVQESVREDIAIKRQVFAEIALAAPPLAILASSTSAIKGSEFLIEITNPERALVAHPVNPPSFIPLVELCGTGKTSEATVSAARKLLSDASMKPIILNKEIDGFILNRLQYTLVAEALHLVGQGYCSPEDIDLVVTEGLALRWAFIGPFAVAHLNAVDGFKGFVERLGPMMRRMGDDARTNYPWTDGDIEKIHRDLSQKRPVDQIPNLQQQRDRDILALRRLKAGSDQMA